MKKTEGFHVPHVYVVLFGLMVVCALLSYVVPAGMYDVEMVKGIEIIRSGTYRRIESTPVSLMQLLSAVPRGMCDAAQVVFFIFMVGGAFGIIQETGVMESAMYSGIRRLKGKTYFIIPVTMLLFSLGAAVFGMLEENLVFIPIFVSMSLAMGYDSITGVAMVLCSSAVGYAGAFINPFTVEMAQGIAGLPMLSGFGYRIMIYMAFLTVTILMITRYAGRVRKDPESSPVYELDRKRKRIDLEGDIKPFGKRERVSMLVFFGAIVLLVVGVMRWDWYMNEIAALFLGMSILIGMIMGVGFSQFAKIFEENMAGIASGALAVGIARGILVILMDGNILHTLLNDAELLLKNLPSMVTSLGMYFFQCLLSVFVASGSGQASISMPILAPLSDLVGVTRQTACIAYQIGDAVSDVITPTCGVLMGALSMVKIPWGKWIRWLLPIVVIQYILGAVFVIVADVISLGPF